MDNNFQNEGNQQNYVNNVIRPFADPMPTESNTDQSASNVMPEPQNTNEAETSTDAQRAEGAFGYPPPPPPYGYGYPYPPQQNQGGYPYGNMTPPQVMPNDPYYAPYVPKPQPKMGDAIRSMVFGILSIEFAFVPLLSIASIVFGAIAKKNGKKIVNANPESKATHGMAKAGRITGMIGFIIGIVITSIYALVLFE